MQVFKAEEYEQSVDQTSLFTSTGGRPQPAENCNLAGQLRTPSAVPPLKGCPGHRALDPPAPSPTPNTECSPRLDFQLLFPKTPRTHPHRPLQPEPQPGLQTESPPQPPLWPSPIPNILSSIQLFPKTSPYRPLLPQQIPPGRGNQCFGWVQHCGKKRNQYQFKCSPAVQGQRSTRRQSTQAIVSMHLRVPLRVGQGLLALRTGRRNRPTISSPQLQRRHRIRLIPSGAKTTSTNTTTGIGIRIILIIFWPLPAGTQTTPTPSCFRERPIIEVNHVPLQFIRFYRVNPLSRLQFCMRFMLLFPHFYRLAMVWHSNREGVWPLLIQ